MLTRVPPADQLEVLRHIAAVNRGESSQEPGWDFDRLNDAYLGAYRSKLLDGTVTPDGKWFTGDGVVTEAGHRSIALADRVRSTPTVPPPGQS